MADPIRAIVRTYTSARDLNGNCYHYCMIYAVKRGIYQTCNVETGGASNGGYLVARILGDHGVSVLTVEETLSKRDWNARRKNLACHYEHEAEAPLREFLLGRK